MTHLVRNAIAHGIEAVAVRSERGKPVVGTIWAAIEHDEAGPIITLEDDGGGVDLEAVARRARTLGLDDTMPPVDLIFEKGLSTRGSSDGLAGRGVGLDAVRAFLLEVGYAIEVVTASGQGTKFILAPASRCPT
jgi:chemotaxis protein histidine kinase CheA